MKKSLAPHGADILSFAAKTGLREDSVSDFSSSVNPLGLPVSAASAYYESLPELLRYPDPQARELCGEIAQRYALATPHVLAGNGAVALLELAIRAVRPRCALLIEPCFSEYRRLLEIHGVEMKRVRLHEKNEFRFPLARIRRAMAGTDMLLLGHPNNPTGTALEREELLELAAAAKKQGAVLLVDEAFCDWCPERSVAAEVGRNPALIVVRSLTKFFCLPGLRAGFVLSAKPLIRRMRLLQETWSCNALAQRLSATALRDQDFQRRGLAWFGSESAFFFKALALVPGLKVFPSLANFFLMKLTRPQARPAFYAALAARGFYVRDHQGFGGGLGPDFFRLALRLRKDNERLLKSFHEILSESTLCYPPV